MRDARRWNLRRKGDKTPVAINGRADEWNTLKHCVTFDEALAHWKANPSKYEGFSFVVAPGENFDDKHIWVALDFDNGIDDNGKPYEWIQNLVDLTDSYTELSRSGRGLHIITQVESLPIAGMGQKKHPEGSAIEVIANGQIAVTGNNYGNPCEVAKQSADWFNIIPFFSTRDAATDDTLANFAEWWQTSFDGLSDDGKTLVSEMENWPEAIRDPNDPCDSHSVLLSAACRLARAGIIGQEAVELLRLCPVDMPWTERELRHKVESAYTITMGDGTYNTIPIATNDGSEFGELDAAEFADLPPDESEQEQADDWFTCEELLLAPPVEYFIPDVLAEGLACVIGGGEKSMKTSIMVEMAISIATKTDFLGNFPVDKTAAVAVISAESGRSSLKSILLRVCQQREIDPNIPGLYWSENPPDLSSSKSLMKLAKKLEEFKVGILMIDPAYMTLPGDGMENVFKVGTLLRQLGKVCKKLGVTLVMAHHTNRKPAGDKFSLRDLSYAGFAEYFRQWIGIRRTSDWIDGVSVLQVDIGSSAGHGNSWSVTIDEGIRDGLVDNRRWLVDVCLVSDLDDPAEQAILDMLSETELMPEKSIIDLSGLAAKKVKQMLARLSRAKKILCMNESYKKKPQDEGTNDESNESLF